MVQPQIQFGPRSFFMNRISLLVLIACIVGCSGDPATMLVLDASHATDSGQTRELDASEIIPRDGGMIVLPSDGGEHSGDAGELGPEDAGEHQDAHQLEFDSGSEAVLDAGHDTVDAGSIIVVPPLDGGATTDAGTVIGTCSVSVGTDVPPLPSVCIPRCATSTLDRFTACTTEECQRAAVESDTTPSTPLSINGNPLLLDCSTCVDYQQLSCAHDVCPTEATALMTCDPETDPSECTPQQTALETCVLENQPAFLSCAETLVGACFGAPEACSVVIGEDLPPLPSACLPRCSSATAQTFATCTTDECRVGALSSDMTASTSLDINGTPQDLDCSTCVNYQQLSCAFDVCPVETAELAGCDAMVDPTECESQEAALVSCIAAHSTTFQPCAQSLIAMCFDR
jgi:hypothetical protein